MYEKLHFVSAIAIFYWKKKINFVYSILWNIVTVCFAAVELVIVLAWFM